MPSDQPVPLPPGLNSAAFAQLEEWDQVDLLIEYMHQLDDQMQWVIDALWERGNCGVGLLMRKHLGLDGPDGMPL